jgi:energy-coupling factor transport system permease protein
MLVVGAVFVAVRVAIAALTTHGVGTALLDVPSFTLPAWLGAVQVGGTVEGVVVAQALADGLVVLAVFVVFGAFNAVVSHHQLVASLPRSAHEVGLVLTVALAFVPSVLAGAREARLADRARTGGTVVRRRRWRRLAVPLMETGLERAVALAESMDARGFGRRAPSGPERVALGALGGALLAAGVMVLGAIGRWPAVTVGGGVTALVALAVAVVAGRRAPACGRLRPTTLRRADVAAMAGSAAVPLAVALVGALGAPGHEALRWAANPPSFPPVHPLPLVLVACLALPALARPATGGGR